jgi:hypothetical protein
VARIRIFSLATSGVPLPRDIVIDREVFIAAARKLANRVIGHRILYSKAETTLMKLRCGPNYQRLDKAEDEATRAQDQACGSEERRLLASRTQPSLEGTDSFQRPFQRVRCSSSISATIT